MRDPQKNCTVSNESNRQKSELWKALILLIQCHYIDCFALNKIKNLKMQKLNQMKKNKIQIFKDKLQNKRLNKKMNKMGWITLL